MIRSYLALAPHGCLESHGVEHVAFYDPDAVGNGVTQPTGAAEVERQPGVGLLQEPPGCVARELAVGAEDEGVRHLRSRAVVTGAAAP